VAGDTNGTWDVFVHDRQAGTTECSSVALGGVTGNTGSYGAVISADGRFVAFTSQASDLVAGGTIGFNIFVRDRQNGTTELVSVSTSGAQGNSDSFDTPSISSDGRYVAFSSYASNLVVGDTNGTQDIFVRDRQLGTTERVSIDSGGVQGNGLSAIPSISADGRRVAFQSQATLVPGDTNLVTDIFVRDRLTNTTERVSITSTGRQGDGSSEVPSISADGRHVAFQSFASNLVAGDSNGFRDVFVHDLQSGRTERVSAATNGAQGNFHSGYPSISGDGRYLAFMSLASNLVPGDTNALVDVFVHDRQSGMTERVSVSTRGAQGADDSFRPALSPDARFVAFGSNANNLVIGDSNGNGDTFVHDRDATGFKSQCEPGVSGVMACPCSNPPAGSGQGCDNSAATGGAILSASGIAYLSIDSLVFTTGDEKPSALSVLTQWTGTNAMGAVFGMGVRCTSGTFKRLYTKHAVSGSITAPEFAVGDSPVSVRSAALGDVILAGQSRLYLVYYRDPVVLGGCPASSTFNATQTGRVDWSL
jgi:Tol biopolymer transport system component